MSDQGLVTVTYECVQTTTDEAICVEIEGEDIWIPKSLIHGGTEDMEAGFASGELEIPEWFAHQEGIV